MVRRPMGKGDEAQGDPGADGAGPVRPLRVGALALALGLAPGGAGAALEFSPFVGMGLVATDNVGLAPPGGEQSDLVTEISPGFGLEYLSPRTNGRVGYRMQNLFFAEFSESNQTYHQLDAGVDVDVVPETFFLGAELGLSQAIVDPGGVVTARRSNAVIAANLTDELRGSIAPSYSQGIGGVARFDAIYRASASRYDNDRAEDFDSQEIDLGFRDDDQGSRLGWAVTYRRQEAEFEDGTEFLYWRAGVELEYRVSSVVGLTASGGQEQDVQQAVEESGLTGGTTTAQIDSPFWLVGIHYAPTPRNDLTASVGERYYGDAYQFAWKREGNRLLLEAAYDETPTTSGLRRSRGASVITPEESPELAGLTPEIFLSRLGRFRIELDLRTSTLGLVAFNDERNYVLDGEDETESGVRGNWLLRLGRRTDLGLTVADRTLTFRESEDREDDYLDVTVGVTRRMSRTFIGTLDYSYFERDSTAPGESYVENAISLRVNAEF